MTRAPRKSELVSYHWRRRVLNQILGDQKEKFISRIECSVTDGQISRDDVKKMIFLADTKELQNLCLESLRAYQGQMKANGHKEYFDEKELILCMLHSNQAVDEALHQFYNEELVHIGSHGMDLFYLKNAHIFHDEQRLDVKRKHEKVEEGYNNRRCYYLMMDMLYSAERYEDVAWLYSKSKAKFPYGDRVLASYYFGSQYHLGTREAFDQVLTELNESFNEDIHLPDRCLLFASLLAFKLQDYAAVLELDCLQVFGQRERDWGREKNLKLLAYVHLDREEEAVSLLRSLLDSNPTKPPLYSDVFDTVKEKVLLADNIELEASLLQIEVALNRENLICYETFESYYERQVSLKSDWYKRLV